MMQQSLVKYKEMGGNQLQSNPRVSEEESGEQPAARALPLVATGPQIDCNSFLANIILKCICLDFKTCLSDLFKGFV